MGSDASQGAPRGLPAGQRAAGPEAAGEAPAASQGAPRGLPGGQRDSVQVKECVSTARSLGKYIKHRDFVCFAPNSYGDVLYFARHFHLHSQAVGHPTASQMPCPYLNHQNDAEISSTNMLHTSQYVKVM
jgi:hypothetical protein